MSKTKKVVLRFCESGSDGLQDFLKILIGRIFQYDDQDGSHIVQLLSIGSTGLATLIDRNKRTGEPLKDAKEYTVSLYDDGVLTYL